MGWDADDGVFGLEQECPVHGDESMTECRMCGAEFCRACHAGPAVCPACAEQGSDDHNLETVEDEDEEEDLDPDVAEVIDSEFGDFDDLDEGDELPSVSRTDPHEE